MTNGEKMQEVFPEGKTRRCRGGVVFESDGWCHAYDSDWWNAEYKDPRKGHWIPRNSFLLQYECSECNCESEKYNFCPNCGADMREVEE